jgi:hypothetical protein
LIDLLIDKEFNVIVLTAPVDGVCVEVVEVGDAFVQLVAALRLLHGHDEEVDVGVEGELVHGVHHPHIVQHKEQDGRSQRARSVTLQDITDEKFFSFC